MHLVGTTASGRLMHTYRRPDTLSNQAGTWTPFVDVETTAKGGIDRGLFNLGDVSCAQTTPPFNIADLHICAVNNTGQVWHVIRNKTFGSDTIGDWTEMGSVESQAGNVGPHRRISCSLHNTSGLHVVTTSKNGEAVWHTIRRPNRTWFPFGAVYGQTGKPGNAYDVAAAVDGDELHVCIATDTGNLLHTIRREGDGSWLPFGSVLDQVGHGFKNKAVNARRLSAWAGGGMLRLWVVTAAGDLIMTLRHPNGRWAPWTDEPAWYTNVPSDIATFGIHGWGEHKAITTNVGGLYHQLLPIGSGDVEGQAGQAGEFRSVAISGG